MRGEDIYNGVTDIRDDQIDEAGRKGRSAGAPRKGRRRFRRWAIPVAAALLLAVAAGAVLNPWGGALAAHAISTADYPKQARYSVLNNDAWGAANRKRREYAEVCEGTLEEFTAAALPALLGGAGTENRVCSPLNLYMALSMLAELTDGESREQILAAISCDDIETVRTRANALWNASYVDDGTVICLPANSLWLDQDMEYVGETLERLSDTYYASSYRGQMGEAGFNRALRQWINGNTGNRLKEQTSGLALDPDTVMAVVSTVYYRAKWSDEFAKGRTSPDTFHAPEGDLTADFMHQTMDGVYYWGERFSAVRKGLKNSYFMWFILPDEGVDMETLLADGEAAELLSSGSEEWENSKYLEIHLSVPKFDVTGDMDLKRPLEAMGVTDVFDPLTADFSPMLTEESAAGLPLPPFLSSVRHAARVAIDEEGCEATSYIELLGAGAAEPPDDEVDFVLNRPFLFAIGDYHGTVLFSGIVNRP